ncbi:MAG TPA: GNAT family N-acetyltransferase [Burkholderiaceae bacterium]|nr:GNAT family N-acetyltransferase [Burkholderiaceae bacterium]
MTIAIREMMQTDDERICEISADCYRFAARVGDFTDAQMESSLLTHGTLAHVASLRTNGIASVAELNGQLVGVIATLENSVQALLVATAAHGMGVGHALFRHAEAAMANAGHQTLTLKTRPSAIPFYLKMGMEFAGHWTPPAGPLAGVELTVLGKSLATSTTNQM